MVFGSRNKGSNPFLLTMLYVIIIIAIIIGIIVIASFPHKGDIYETNYHYFRYIKITNVGKRVCGYWINNDKTLKQYYCIPLFQFLLEFKKKK